MSHWSAEITLSLTGGTNGMGFAGDISKTAYGGVGGHAGAIVNKTIKCIFLYSRKLKENPFH